MYFSKSDSKEIKNTINSQLHSHVLLVANWYAVLTINTFAIMGGYNTDKWLYQMKVSNIITYSES